MRAYTRRRLLASVKLGLATVPFAELFRWSDPEALVQGSILLGFSLGFVVGAAELFLLRNLFRDLSFIPHLLVKSVTLIVAMYVAFAIVNVLDVVIAGVSWGEYFQTLISGSVLLEMMLALAVVAFLLFFVHLDRLLGPGVLLGFVTGRYHRPRHEDRIFMFLDLTGSTTLADRMDGDRYFGFLQRYFAEMSEPILETNAEIYQYVGDEVVLSWKMAEGLEEAGCVRVFFLIQDQLQASRDTFLHDFGAVPTFKAGLHAGQVIAAQIGELKSEIVYNGDVLNTTARIEAQCNPLGHRLLASESLVSRLSLGPDYEVLALGPVPLRGKGEDVNLCAIDRVRLPTADTRPRD